MELFEEIVEPTLIQPTFVYDYPPAAQPLARPHREKPGLIEAWDLIIGGMERGTAFSELIDPVVQRERLTEQSLLSAAGDDEAMQLDEDFLRALEHGAPHGWSGPRSRPPDHALHEPRNPGDHSVPVDEAGVSRTRGILRTAFAQSRRG